MTDPQQSQDAEDKQDTNEASGNASDKSMTASRQIALEILHSILDRKQALDIVIDRHDGFKSLTQQDRGFVRMIVSTTLRNLGQIDDMIRRASNRKDAPSPPLLHTLLRQSITQIIFMNVPDYAVVDTAVRLAEDNDMSRQKGYVNAVLRQTVRQGQSWVSKQDPVTLNIPDWLMRLWIQDYGLRTAAEIGQASLAEAPLDITLKNNADTLHWEKTLEATALPTGSLRMHSNPSVTALPGFDDGMWWIQDAAAALPAKLFGNDLTGKTVHDLCAAPGGKTMQLAAMGANVVAVDRSATRLKRLTENLVRVRLQDTVNTVAADSTSYKPAQPADYILLDAPCSATGTIRRNPDTLHLKSEQDIARLMDIQTRLLDHAISILNPGGTIIYCTCSLQKGEGEAQVDAALSRHPNMMRDPISANEVGSIEEIVTEQGDVRVLPFALATHGGMDGFYIARLKSKV